MNSAEPNNGNVGEILSPFENNSDIGGNFTSSKFMSQEGVYQLTKDLRAFSEALTALKSVFLDEQNIVNQGFRVSAHERLGELLQVLKIVVNKYSELNSGDILAVAKELIKYVKEYNYEDNSIEVSPDIFRAINNLAMAFSNSVSECLMGDAGIASPISPPCDDFIPKSNISDEAIESQSSISDSIPTEKTISVDKTDELLHQTEGGFEIACERSKVLSKYLGDLINYVKKKAHLEIEHAKNLSKLSQQTKSILSEQSFLPLQSLYCTGLDHDREFANSCATMYQNALLQQKFVDSLQAKKTELDKQRKYIRDWWMKDKRRLEESVISLKKSKQIYQTKVNDHQKAKEATLKAEEDQLSIQTQPVKPSSSSTGSAFGSVLLSSSGASKIDKRKKHEEDISLKAASAEQAYKISVHEANKRLKELDKNKALYLQQLRELMLGCDKTVKSVTTAYFQLHHHLFSPIPIQFQALCEDAKIYEPGFQYTEYVRHIPTQIIRNRTIAFEFESCSIDGSSYRVSGLSDTESSSSPSFDDQSPSTSPGNLLRQSEASRRHSTGGSISSEEILDDKMKDDKSSSLHPISPSVSDIAGESSPIPLRSITKKGLKVAANVRGAFKTKKPSKSMIFGVDFSIASQGSPDGIPYLVKRCVVEIDNRALLIKGIYRVNGVKNRVEKLCAQFDSSPDKVDLSTQSPHDVSGVLKYFFRQLPDPLLQFEYYDTFLEIAKDYQQVIDSMNQASNQAKDDQTSSAPVPSADVMNSHISRVRDTVEKLPLENRNTLQYVISHLSRVSVHSHDNKMTSSNLAIVFGPTLLRPATTDGNESLKMLIDLPFQSRIVEMLIIHKDFIFGTHSHQAGNIFPFSGFQAQPRFPADDKNPSQLVESTLSHDLDTNPKANKDDNIISPDRDILLTFDDDRVSTSTDHSAGDSQYNTNSLSNKQFTSEGNRTIIPDRTGLNSTSQSQPPKGGSYSEELLSISVDVSNNLSASSSNQSTFYSSNTFFADIVQMNENITAPPVPSRVHRSLKLSASSLAGKTDEKTSNSSRRRNSSKKDQFEIVSPAASVEDLFQFQNRKLSETLKEKPVFDRNQFENLNIKQESVSAGNFKNKEFVDLLYLDNFDENDQCDSSHC